MTVAARRPHGKCRVKIASGPVAVVLSLFIGAGAFAATKTAAHSTFEPTVADVGSDSITIQTGRNAGMKFTHLGNTGDVEDTTVPSNMKQLKVDKFTIITIDDLPGTLADVKVGMAAHFVQGMDPGVAGSIDVHTVPPAQEASPTPAKKTKGAVRGPAGPPRAALRKITSDTVLSISPTRITVGQAGAKMARAYYITPTTTVTIDGHHGSLADLHEGMKVAVHADTTTANEIVAHGEE